MARVNVFFVDFLNVIKWGIHCFSVWRDSLTKILNFMVSSSLSSSSSSSLVYFILIFFLFWFISKNLISFVRLFVCWFCYLKTIEILNGNKHKKASDLLLCNLLHKLLLLFLMLLLQLCFWCSKCNHKMLHFIFFFFF